MLTEKQLIDQIRSELREELSNLHPPVALPGLVWPQARAGRRRPSTRVRRWRARGRSLAFGFSTLATVGVAALALVLLGHARHSSVGRSETGKGLTATITGHGSRVLGTAAALRTEIHALRGHPIVIMAWGTWCPPCVNQLPVFASVARRYRQRVAFLGVAIGDTPRSARSYLGEHPVRYPNFRATLNQLHRILRTPTAGLPTTFFLSPAGKVLSVHTGQYLSSQSLRRDLEVLLLETSLPEAGPGPRQVPGVSPLLTKNFAVFRRPRARQPRLPSWTGFSPSFDAHWGFDPAKTQYVAFGRGIQIWLVPGSRSLCMVESGPAVGRPPFRRRIQGSSCGPISNALPGFPRVGEAGPGNTRAWIGLVPDGATVTVTTRAGATVKVPVVDNVGYITSVSGFRKAEIRYANGRVKTY